MWKLESSKAGVDDTVLVGGALDAEPTPDADTNVGDQETFYFDDHRTKSFVLDTRKCNANRARQTLQLGALVWVIGDRGLTYSPASIDNGCRIEGIAQNQL